MDVDKNVDTIEVPFYEGCLNNKANEENEYVR